MVHRPADLLLLLLNLIKAILNNNLAKIKAPHHLRIVGQVDITLRPRALLSNLREARQSSSCFLLFAPLGVELPHDILFGWRLRESFVGVVGVGDLSESFEASEGYAAGDVVV